MSLDEQLRRQATDKKDHPALLFDEGAICYGEMNELVDRLGRGLINSGIGPQERIGILVPKRLEMIIAFFAVFRAGAVAVPLNFRLERSQLEQILAHLQLSALLADDELVPLIEQNRSVLPAPNRIFLTGSELRSTTGAAARAWSDLVVSRRSSGPLPLPSPEATAYIDFTSGSTGAPKGILATHEALDWNTASVVASLGLSPGDIHLPLFAVYSHPHEMFARSVTLGGTTVLLDSINPKAIAAALEKWSVTCMMGLPPIYEVLLATLQGSRRRLEHLRLLESGGMVTPWELIERYHRLHRKRIVPVWGSTETAGVSLHNSQALEHRDESMGVPCRGVEVSIAGEKDDPATEGGVGEMTIRSGSLYREAILLDETGPVPRRSDPYRSGDLVRQDGLGRFHFISRKDEMMKVAGMKVYPAEIERVLKTHPRVADAVVVAVKTRARGVIPKAYVVAEGGPVTASALRRYCRQHLASYKSPRIVQFIGSLPRTGSGKPDRRALADAGPSRDGVQEE